MTLVVMNRGSMVATMGSGSPGGGGSGCCCSRTAACSGSLGA